MANKIVLLDTSVLIEYFRRTDKSKTKLIGLLDNNFDISISVITQYEIYTGASPGQTAYWQDFLQKFIVLPFDRSAASAAVEINKTQKRNRNLIDMADLFIAAIALSNELPIATLNHKHFERVDGLILV